MTKQEADFIGSMNMCDEISNEAYKKIICHCDVEESQPCEDCISRDEVIEALITIEQQQNIKDWLSYWLSTFNTESATCCFTAVQQLKEKLNGQMD